MLECVANVLDFIWPRTVVGQQHVQPTLGSTMSDSDVTLAADGDMMNDHIMTYLLRRSSTDNI